jgi:hypothetical protein
MLSYQSFNGLILDSVIGSLIAPVLQRLMVTARGLASRAALTFSTSGTFA